MKLEDLGIASRAQPEGEFGVGAGRGSGEGRGGEERGRRKSQAGLTVRCLFSCSQWQLPWLPRSLWLSRSLWLPRSPWLP